MRLLGGRYRLDRPVGRGGTAVVWSAYDLVLRRTVAVKMLSELPAADRPDEDTARREALAAARLSHPHIAGVYDYGETGEGGRRKPFLVMEFVSGPTLAQRIADDGPLDWREAATICAQVADALAAAHDSGLVHRDIKPGNVMLPTTGVKVVDFGVAAAAGDDSADVHGRIWGTPGYIAPEQLVRGRVLPAGDVHALGLLLYESLAGRPPWRSTGAADVLEERRRMPVPELPLPPGLPAAVVQIYRECLRSEPEARPSARHVAGVLHAAALSPVNTSKSTPQQEMAVTRAQHRHRGSRRLVALASAPAAVVAAVLAVQLSSAGPSEPAAQQGSGDEGLPTADAACHADYTSLRRPDGSFTARLAVTNTGQQSLGDWAVGFVVPHGQRVTDVEGASWAQERRMVTLTADRRLPPGATTTVSFQGTFDRADDHVPGGFTVAGVECAQAITQVRTSPTPAPAQGRSRDRGTGDQKAPDDVAATDDPTTPGSPPAMAPSAVAPASASPTPDSDPEPEDSAPPEEPSTPPVSDAPGPATSVSPNPQTSDPAASAAPTSSGAVQRE